MTSPTSITTEAFLDQVHRHLTPVVETRGYVFCGGGEGRAAAEPMLLLRSSGWTTSTWLRRKWPLRRQPTEPVMSAGYEAEDDDDERWVHYYPERQLLDLSDFFGAGTGETVTRHELADRLRTAAGHVADTGLGA